MPTSVTYVTEEHFFFVKGALAYLALVSSERGLPVGLRGRDMGAGGGG